MFFTVEKLERQLRDVRAAVRRGAIDIPRWKHWDGDAPGGQQPDLDDGGWADFRVGDTWGCYDAVAWFRARVPIPEAWRENKLALRFLVGPRDGAGSTAETLLFVDGLPLQGIDVWHDEAVLPPEVAARDELAVALRAWYGVLNVPICRRFRLAQLVWIDEPTERLSYLAGTVLAAVKVLDPNDLRRAQLLQAVDDAFQCVNLARPGSDEFYACAAAAEADLRAAVDALSSMPEIKPAVTGIGHAHLDMAWLWRLDHTVDKAARTFATALNLMRQYPEYRFMHSSPQLYKLVAERYPDIYRQVKARIAEGRWEITGGMWVEADTNLTGGESLVRQFLHGSRFIKQEFGRQSSVLWLPDVFGYSAALPQIALKSGFRFFVTSKISWNQFNRFPYDTFRWRGLDGTEILTYFVTTPETPLARYTYNGRLAPDDVKGEWDNYQQKAVNDELLMLFGWGDGGGGPTREMLESARVLKNLPGLPRVRQGPAEEFCARLEQRLAAHPERVPVWDGELYLEYHRGTYTSQAFVKRANRKSEILFHDAELLSALADILTGEHAYPRAELACAWERLLLNQFHDILPGSSIHAVYDDCRRDYAWIGEVGEGALAHAARTIAGRVPAAGPAVVVFNTLPWPRDALVTLPWPDAPEGGAVLDASGRPLPAQRVAGPDGRPALLVLARDVPALGYRTFEMGTIESGFTTQDTARAKGTKDGEDPEDRKDREDRAWCSVWRDGAGHVLENDVLRLAVDEQGHLTSVWDKRHGREVLAPGARGNVIQVFEDRPMDFDAWDIDIYYQDKMMIVDDLAEAAVEEAGPLRATLRLAWRFYGSTLTQRLSLVAGSPRVDFETEIDWQERQLLPKVAFPVNIRALRATYEVQFGVVERPTHRNTSWDTARFEVVAHKWADLSEGDYGVALLNDCKYGHDIHDNVMRLTLLKSAIDPDPEADRGCHHFTYSLLPHAGGWRSGGVQAAAYALNYPLHTAPIPRAQSGDLPAAVSLAAVDAPHVVLETVKQAEDGDGWIVRLYESRQARNPAARLTFGRPLRRAVECNLVEEDERPAAYEGSTLTFAIAPFQIKTFKVWF